MSVLKEFREFAMKGNVVDLAIGVIIGAAFGKIVSSAVNDVLMPPLGLLLGGMDFGYLALTLKDAVGSEPAVLLRYGQFINAVIDFVIVAFAIFLLIRTINRFRRKEEAPPPAPVAKECPECRMNIPLTARRCPHCTTVLDGSGDKSVVDLSRKGTTI